MTRAICDLLLNSAANLELSSRCMNKPASHLLYVKRRYFFNFPPSGS
jgi:hypothetical protein